MKPEQHELSAVLVLSDGTAKLREEAHAAVMETLHDGRQYIALVHRVSPVDLAPATLQTWCRKAYAHVHQPVTDGTVWLEIAFSIGARRERLCSMRRLGKSPDGTLRATPADLDLTTTMVAVAQPAIDLLLDLGV